MPTDQVLKKEKKLHTSKALWFLKRTGCFCCWPELALEGAVSTRAKFQALRMYWRSHDIAVGLIFISLTFPVDLHDLSTLHAVVSCYRVRDLNQWELHCKTTPNHQNLEYHCSNINLMVMKSGVKLFLENWGVKNWLMWNLIDASYAAKISKTTNCLDGQTQCIRLPHKVGSGEGL